MRQFLRLVIARSVATWQSRKRSRVLQCRSHPKSCLDCRNPAALAMMVASVRGEALSLGGRERVANGFVGWKVLSQIMNKLQDSKKLAIALQGCRSNPSHRPEGRGFKPELVLR
jgi:hypothetical protein